ncbi:hypothetical protein KPB05_10125 [Burkholderia gladioli]|uniref:hypothetical protein n=1 Tax=Burkholderia gladioli TaxID=28095 RepID=UPI00285FEF87|nr:hypothetical protein [Burkholderia gladioli]MDR8087817.1 hypothetical protein [Burkholderia gladioli]
MGKKITSKEKVVPSWQIEEAKALAAIFSEKADISQAEFGAKYGIGTQGMVWQYLNGHRPLNIAAATAFSIGLDAPIGTFSPRLADEITRAYGQVTGDGDHRLSPAAAAVVSAVRKADKAGEPVQTFTLMLRMVPDHDEPLDGTLPNP